MRTKTSFSISDGNELIRPDQPRVAPCPQGPHTVGAFRPAASFRWRRHPVPGLVYASFLDVVALFPCSARRRCVLIRQLDMALAWVSKRCPKLVNGEQGM